MGKGEGKSQRRTLSVTLCPPSMGPSHTDLKYSLPFHHHSSLQVLGPNRGVLPLPHLEQLFVCLFSLKAHPGGVCDHTGALKSSTLTQPAVVGKGRPGRAISSAPSALGPTALSHAQEEMLLSPGRVEAGLFLLY